jgi:hypothetical protein
MEVKQRGDIMKSLLFIFCLLMLSVSTFAQVAQISSIDDDDTPPPYVDVFEEALPLSLYLQLNRQLEDVNDTAISETRASELFNMLKRDPKARMRNPGGLCSYRRVHIKNVLKRMNVASGRLYISCPDNNGRLRLRDQVSGRYYTFSNFHDANTVVVSTVAGNSYRVMDLQFESGPATLPNYLAQIQAYQRVLPGKRSDDAGTCYWRLSPSALMSEEFREIPESFFNM